jgi:hypothetical protein
MQFIKQRFPRVLVQLGFNWGFGTDPVEKDWSFEVWNNLKGCE